MGKLIDVDKFLKKVKKDREHEIYLHSWTADMVLERLDSWYAPSVETIPKDQYEARLKADMMAMLEEIKLELDEARLSSCDICIGNEYQNLIQQKINELSGNAE